MEQKYTINKFIEIFNKIMIICLGLTGIAFVIDTMLTYTFPAYTLIGLIILLTVFLVKTYEKYRHQKLNERYKNQYMD